jgi:hypothetical protein
MDLILLVAITAFAMRIVQKLQNDFLGILRFVFPATMAMACSLAIAGPIVALKQILLGRRAGLWPGERLWVLQGTIYGALTVLLLTFPESRMILPLFLAFEIVLSVLVVLAVADTLADHRLRNEPWSSWVGLGFGIIPGVLTLVFGFL